MPFFPISSGLQNGKPEANCGSASQFWKPHQRLACFCKGVPIWVCLLFEGPRFGRFTGRSKRQPPTFGRPRKKDLPILRNALGKIFWAHLSLAMLPIEPQPREAADQRILHGVAIVPAHLSPNCQTTRACALFRVPFSGCLQTSPLTHAVGQKKVPNMEPG